MYKKKSLVHGEHFNFGGAKMKRARQILLGLSRILHPPGMLVSIAQIGETVLVGVRVVCYEKVVASAKSRPIVRMRINGSFGLRTLHQKGLIIFRILS